MKKLRLPSWLRQSVELAKSTAKIWNRSDPWRLSAVVAYYALLSLPGLLVVVIRIVSGIWDQQEVEGQLSQEFSQTMGPDTAQTVEDMIENSRTAGKNWITTIIGIGSLVFGATGVFYHLQISLNSVWNISDDSNAGFKAVVIDRLVSFGFVVAMGFLFLVSFIVTAVLSAISFRLKLLFPDLVVILVQALDFVVGVAVIGFMFTLLFRFLPHARAPWKALRIGALITAVLFAVGKALIGVYFGHAEPGSTYGAAGSLILILLWVSYASLILFFGAAFIRAYCEKYYEPIRPSLLGRKVPDKELDEMPGKTA